MTKLTDYVKTAEAAEILGVAQDTLRKWAAAGAIPVRSQCLTTRPMAIAKPIKPT